MQDAELSEFGDPLIIAGNTARFPVKGLREELVFSPDTARIFAEKLLRAATQMDGHSYASWRSRRDSRSSQYAGEA